MGCTPDVCSGGDLGWGVHQTWVVGTPDACSEGDLWWGVHQTWVVGVIWGGVYTRRG